MPPKRETLQAKVTDKKQDLPIPEEYLHDELKLTKYLWDFICDCRFQTNPTRFDESSSDGTHRSAETKQPEPAAEPIRSSNQGTGVRKSSDPVQPEAGDPYASFYEQTRSRVLQWATDGGLRQYKEREEAYRKWREEWRDWNDYHRPMPHPHVRELQEQQQAKEATELEQFKKRQQECGSRRVRRLNFFKYQKEDRDHFSKQQFKQCQQQNGTGQAPGHRGHRSGRGKHCTRYTYL